MATSGPGFFTHLLGRQPPIPAQQPQPQQQPLQQPAGTPPANQGGQGGGQGPGNGPGSSMQLNGGGNPGSGGGNQPSNFVLPNQPGGGNQPNPNGGSQGDGNTNANASPLDRFSSLWQNPNKDGTAPVDPFSQPLLNADPAKIAEAARSHDFKQAIPQELLQKALGGDATSMLEIINNVGQQALTVAAQLSTATAEFAGRGVQDRFDKVFPDRFRQQQLGSIKPKNPVLEHPNAAPLLKMLRNQAAANNPGWTPDQVAQWAEDYLTDFSGQMSPQQQPQQQAGGASNGAGQDWDAWVSGQGNTNV